MIGPTIGKNDWLGMIPDALLISKPYLASELYPSGRLRPKLVMLVWASVR